ncbi:MAG TPA: hypothetical protein VKK79_17585 [Candidatus Lokiarchaeia archaeon]|nr:hypothetical protein [Candidatus Lokiarchaeia archaeon]
MPVKVAFMQLASCWGCHQSLLNAHLGLLDVLPALDIVYWPAVVDFKRDSLKAREPGEIVVGFLEGHIRTEEDVENVKLMREKCKILVAYGTCACYGSITGLANLYSMEELTQTKFFTQPTYDDSTQIPSENVPAFEESVKPVEAIVPVDVRLPGCPPRTENIIGAVTTLLNALPLLLAEPAEEAACATCTLASSGCLLDSGSLCFGGISAGPGKEFTPTAAKPHLGDYGPSKVASEAQADKLADLVSQKKLDEDDVKKINEFLLLYTRLPNFGYFDLTSSFIEKFGLEVKPFPVKDVNGKKAFDVAIAGDAKINEVLGQVLYKLKHSPLFSYSVRCACDSCGRERVKKYLGDIKRDYEGLPDFNRCLLEQGYVCLGPVTRVGCGTICPNQGNAPCAGCYGPTGGVKDMGSAMLSTLCSIAMDMDGKKVVERVKDPAGLFYRFTYASSLIPHKVQDSVAKEGGEE